MDCLRCYPLPRLRRDIPRRYLPDATDAKLFASEDTSR
jgi:hypothetical protein